MAPTVPTDRTVIDSLQRFEIELYAETSLQVLKLRYHGELEPLDFSMTHDETLAALPAMASAKGSYLPGNSGWHPMLESAFNVSSRGHSTGRTDPVAPGTVSEVRTTRRHASCVFSLKHPIDGIDLMVGPWKINEREVQVGDASIRLRTYFDANASALANSIWMQRMLSSSAIQRKSGLIRIPSSAWFRARSRPDSECRRSLTSVRLYFTTRLFATYLWDTKFCTTGGAMAYA